MKAPDVTILARVDRARLALMEAKTAIEAKKVADMAKAAEVFATRQKSAQIKEYAHSVYVDALRLEGEFLEAQPKQNGSRGIGKSGVLAADPTLKDQGISKNESSLAQRVSKAARECPELVDKCRNGKAKLTDIARHFKKAEHRKRRRNPVVSSRGPFGLVLADPPWKYEHCEAANRKIENQYPTAPLQEICSHINRIPLEADCILMLWATAPKLQEALQVMEAWGFNYRSCAVWDKTKIGMGYWWRIQHELLLLGVRGKPGATPECERVSSIFKEPRSTHSVKPECIYEWIEKAFPQLSKLEMYCRNSRKSWSTWGNEC